MRQGRYDRVHSGASCRPSRLRTLVALLRPGGLLVPPRARRRRPACGEVLLSSPLL